MNQSNQPKTTTEDTTNRIDLVALAAELNAAGIPVVPWKHYLHIPGLQCCDVFSDGAVYIGTERITVDTLKALAIVTRHTTPAPSGRSQPRPAGPTTDGEGV